MTRIYLDAETIPDQRAGAEAKILEGITAPANYKKPESIEKWIKENGPAAAHEQWLKTGLKGISGEIVSISWAVNDGDIDGHIRLPGESEADLIDAFFADVMTNIRDGEGAHPSLTWIGHNVIDFDLRFIKQRCIVRNIRPPFVIPADAKHGGKSVFDTMKAWAGWKGFVSQEALCEALGIGGKPDGMSGADVWPMYERGEYEGILDYNKDDVRIVREIHQRMVWA